MQFSLRNLIMATAAFAFCLAFAGRDSKKGSVIVSQQNGQFVEFVLAEHGIRSYEMCSSLGISRFYFFNADERAFVEDAIEKDALKRGYCLKIKHMTILPPFTSEKIVNSEIGISSDR